jgi:hypothetical protein
MFMNLPSTADLCGFFIDSHDGPMPSTRQVAKQKNNAQQPSKFIRELNSMTTNVLSTSTDREANFAHQGWSLSAMSVTAPWIASRIAKNNKVPEKNLWVTKRIVVRRLTVNLTLRDLEATPEFEGDVLAALGKPSKFEKFQALDEVFRVW